MEKGGVATIEPTTPSYTHPEEKKMERRQLGLHRYIFFLFVCLSPPSCPFPSIYAREDNINGFETRHLETHVLGPRYTSACLEPFRVRARMLACLGCITSFEVAFSAWV